MKGEQSTMSYTHTHTEQKNNMKTMSAEKARAEIST